jgi:hypothetical protein
VRKSDSTKYEDQTVVDSGAKIGQCEYGTAEKSDSMVSTSLKKKHENRTVKISFKKFIKIIILKNATEFN